MTIKLLTLSGLGEKRKNYSFIFAIQCRIQCWYNPPPLSPFPHILLNIFSITTEVGACSKLSSITLRLIWGYCNCCSYFQIFLGIISRFFFVKFNQSVILTVPKTILSCQTYFVRRYRHVRQLHPLKPYKTIYYFYYLTAVKFPRQKHFHSIQKLQFLQVTKLQKDYIYS